MVPGTGLEPVRYHYHWILSPTRLPIPSPGDAITNIAKIVDKYNINLSSCRILK